MVPHIYMLAVSIFFVAEAEGLEQAPVVIVVLFGRESEALEAAFAQWYTLNTNPISKAAPRVAFSLLMSSWVNPFREGLGIDERRFVERSVSFA